MGDPSDPLSLNRYVYCQLDPVNFVDPTGFMGITLFGQVEAELGLSDNLQWGYTYQAGIGRFQNGGSYMGGDRIYYESYGAITDVNKKQNGEFIAGGYTGVGVGVTFTSADSAEDYADIPRLFDLNTPLGSISFGYGNGEFALSVSIGPGLGASTSDYSTTTNPYFW
jgi:hypothetical protein